MGEVEESSERSEIVSSELLEDAECLEDLEPFLTETVGLEPGLAWGMNAWGEAADPCDRLPLLETLM